MLEQDNLKLKEKSNSDLQNSSQGKDASLPSRAARNTRWLAQILQDAYQVQPPKSTFQVSCAHKKFPTYVALKNINDFYS